jgi:putative ABC transport system permease protein
VRLVAAVAALLRRARVERGVVVLVFVVVALTSFAVAAAPRLFNRVADAGLRYEAGHATAIQRNLQFTSVDRLPSGTTDPFERIVARGDGLRTSLPPSVRNLVGDAGYTVDMTRFRLADPPRFTTFVTFRQQAALEDQIDLVAGHWPDRVVPDADADPNDPPTFEIALSDASAAAIGVAVGDTLAANVDSGDPLLRNVFPRPVSEIRIIVVGTFTVRDAAAPFWFDDRSLGEVSIGGTDDDPIAFATALFAPAAYADLLELDLPSRYRWLLFVDIDKLDAGAVDALAPDLRRLGSTFATTGSVRAGSPLLRTGLLGVVERYLEQRATTEAALSIAALGPLTVAVAAVGLIGVLVVRRRRPALALARGRGASGAQLLLAQLWEGLLITVPAALAGLLAALAVVTARASEISSIGVLLVALVATALLILATWPVARRARRELERDDPPVFRTTPRRLVFETLVIVVSLGGAWLLRERGLAGETTRGVATGFDPFLAASPVLIGIAVGLLTIRVYPIPVRALGWWTARRRDLVPVLGLRALGRHPTAGYLPLLILMVTMAIGTLSSVLQASVERSQAQVSWQEVGADFRIESAFGRPLDPRVDPRTLDGVEAAAAGFKLDNAQLTTTPGTLSTLLLHAVEPAAYDAVLAGTPAAVTLSTWLAGSPTGADAGTSGQPIPAIVSTKLGLGSPTLADGDLFELTVNGQAMMFQVAERLDGFPGISTGRPFVVASFGSIAAASGGTPLRASVYFVRGPAMLEPALRASVTGTPALAAVISRHDRYAGMHDAPLVAAVGDGFALALVVAAGYAVLAVVAVSVLHAQRRSREAAFLRTLGLSDRQVGLLTLVEQGLPLVLALATGVVLGLALAWLVAPGIDLAAFSSPGVTVILQVDWTSIAAASTVIVTVVAVAVTISSWFALRSDVGRALRIGDE